MKEAKEDLPPALRFYTSDGVLIAPGLEITNYDMREDVVLNLMYVEEEMIFGRKTGKSVAWWRTEKGVFDGSRMQSR